MCRKFWKTHWNISGSKWYPTLNQSTGEKYKLLMSLLRKKNKLMKFTTLLIKKKKRRFGKGNEWCTYHEKSMKLLALKYQIESSNGSFFCRLFVAGFLTVTAKSCTGGMEELQLRLKLLHVQHCKLILFWWEISCTKIVFHVYYNEIAEKYRFLLNFLDLNNFFWNIDSRWES